MSDQPNYAIFDEIPGDVYDACHTPFTVLVTFINAPWPVVFTPAEFRRANRMDYGFALYWWHKHRALQRRCAAFTPWLERALDLERSYTSPEVISALIKAGCPAQLLVDEMLPERLRLMHQWNEWPERVATGRDYITLPHHEARPIPDLKASLQMADLFQHIDRRKRYSLQEILGMVPEAEVTPFLFALLRKVQRGWGEPVLFGSQWIAGAEMELL